MMSDGHCAHIDVITSVKQPKRREWAECLKTGATWVHLRTCQECGTTLCCDDSANRHARKHAHALAMPSSYPQSGVSVGSIAIRTTNSQNEDGRILSMVRMPQGDPMAITIVAL